ncbi:MAG: hypothetical protein K2X86_02645 [Cytophagaceae bacterium]|nr:hypothetical protein [Cytophagaceae bacterium]
MKIIILGASGQIGKGLYDFLKRNLQGEVIGTSRKPCKEFFLFDPFNDYWKKLGSADVIINCVGQIHASKEYSFHKIHTELTKIIIANRAILGNPRIIQLSALGADPTHPVDFLSTKGMADEYLKKYPDTVCVRPSIVCTHNTMLVRKLKMIGSIARFTAGLIFVPKKFLNHKIQPVLSEDLYTIIFRLCEADHVPPVLNVTGYEQLRFKELFDLMGEARKKKYRYVEIPEKILATLIKYITSPLLPGIINSQQYRLLFEDNIADRKEGEKYLGISISSTKKFWREELK